MVIRRRSRPCRKHWIGWIRTSWRRRTSSKQKELDVISNPMQVYQAAGGGGMLQGGMPGGGMGSARGGNSRPTVEEFDQFDVCIKHFGIKHKVFESYRCGRPCSKLVLGLLATCQCPGKACAWNSMLGGHMRKESERNTVDPLVRLRRNLYTAYLPRAT